MQKSRMTVAVAALVVVGAGCSGEDIAERIAENRIESETGQDVDLNFDDGDFSIKSEDGELSIQTDADGNVSVEADGFGDDDQTFTVDSEDGETVIETDEGTMTFSQNGDLPDDFPPDVPVPSDLAVLTVQEATTADGQAFVVIGSTQRSVEDVAGEIIAGLEAAGYEQQQVTTTPDGSLFVYEKGERVVSGTIGRSDEETNVLLNVTPTSG